jgi:hypothetical protein
VDFLFFDSVLIKCYNRKMCLVRQCLVGNKAEKFEQSDCFSGFDELLRLVDRLYRMNIQQRIA